MTVDGAAACVATARTQKVRFLQKPDSALLFSNAVSLINCLLAQRLAGELTKLTNQSHHDPENLQVALGANDGIGRIGRQ